MSKPEFSRPVRFDDIPPEGLVQNLLANQEECARLAERFGIVKLTRLEGIFELVHKGPEVRVTGSLVADAVQNCVVTLEPREEAVRVSVLRSFRPAPPGVSAGDEPVLSADQTEALTDLDQTGDAAEVDWVFDGRIDLGEMLAEELALALEPYPRAPGIRLEDVLGGMTGERDAHPFAALQRLKEPQGPERS